MSKRKLPPPPRCEAELLGLPREAFERVMGCLPVLNIRRLAVVTRKWFYLHHPYFVESLVIDARMLERVPFQVQRHFYGSFIMLRHIAAPNGVPRHLEDALFDILDKNAPSLESIALCPPRGGRRESPSTGGLFSAPEQFSPQVRDKILKMAEQGKLPKLTCLRLPQLTPRALITLLEGIAHRATPRPAASQGKPTSLPQAPSAGESAPAAASPSGRRPSGGGASTRTLRVDCAAMPNLVPGTAVAAAGALAAARASGAHVELHVASVSLSFGSYVESRNPAAIPMYRELARGLRAISVTVGAMHHRRFSQEAIEPAAEPQPEQQLVVLPELVYLHFDGVPVAGTLPPWLGVDAVECVSFDFSLLRRFAVPFELPTALQAAANVRSIELLAYQSPQDPEEASPLQLILRSRAEGGALLGQTVECLTLPELGHREAVDLGRVSLPSLAILSVGHWSAELSEQQAARIAQAAPRLTEIASGAAEAADEQAEHEDAAAKMLVRATTTTTGLARRATAAVMELAVAAVPKVAALDVVGKVKRLAEAMSRDGRTLVVNGEPLVISGSRRGSTGR